jgi:hypothetical protein
MLQTHAPQVTRARSFARFETRFQIGWVAGAVAATAIAIPIRYSLVVLAGLLVPAAVLYLRTVREGHAAHAADPYDPIEVARRRIDHAAEWHRRELDRLAVTELAGVVDLARASGLHADPTDLIRLDALRAAAMSTWPLDPREVEWAMVHAAGLVERLATNGDAPAPVQEVAEGTTDSDVTVHCEERMPTVSTRLDESTAER